MTATDELRAMAESVGLAMPQAATKMMEAADTIDRLDAENDKLREEVEQWHRLTAGIELPEYPITEFKPKDFERENAKLRDLCEWLLEPYRLGAVTGEGVDKQWCRETYDGGSYRLRELGNASGAMSAKGEPSGTCHADETETFECVCDGIGHYGEFLTVHVIECGACGRTYEHVNGDYEYCPHCGRKVVSE